MKEPDESPIEIPAHEEHPLEPKITQNITELISSVGKHSEEGPITGEQLGTLVKLSDTVLSDLKYEDLTQKIKLSLEQEKNNSSKNPRITKQNRKAAAQKLKLTACTQGKMHKGSKGGQEQITKPTGKADKNDLFQPGQKYMCQLPMSEEKAFDLHQQIKDCIRDHGLRLKAWNLKNKFRDIQDHIQKIKTCHGNRRRQKELRAQNKELKQKLQVQDLPTGCSPNEEVPVDNSKGLSSRIQVENLAQANPSGLQEKAGGPASPLLVETLQIIAGKIGEFIDSQRRDLKNEANSIMASCRSVSKDDVKQQQTCSNINPNEQLIKLFDEKLVEIKQMTQREFDDLRDSLPRSPSPGQSQLLGKRAHSKVGGQPATPNDDQSNSSTVTEKNNEAEANEMAAKSSSICQKQLAESSLQPSLEARNSSATILAQEQAGAANRPVLLASHHSSSGHTAPIHRSSQGEDAILQSSLQTQQPGQTCGKEDPQPNIESQYNQARSMDLTSFMKNLESQNPMTSTAFEILYNAIKLELAVEGQNKQPAVPDKQALKQSSKLMYQAASHPSTNRLFTAIKNASNLMNQKAQSTGSKMSSKMTQHSSEQQESPRPLPSTIWKPQQQKVNMNNGLNVRLLPPHSTALAPPHDKSRSNQHNLLPKVEQAVPYSHGLKVYCNLYKSTDPVPRQPAAPSTLMMNGAPIHSGAPKQSLCSPKLQAMQQGQQAPPAKKPQTARPVSSVNTIFYHNSNVGIPPSGNSPASASPNYNK